VATELKSALDDFVRFAQTLRGDEKSEAQPFLDHLFRALGHEGVIEAGATFEFRVAKKPGSPQLELVVAGNGDPGRALRTKGGKKFADLLWPDRVLIEMKSRGEKLERYYDQAFDYWTHIVPKRPPLVILCNFDEFWIYDFNTQLFDPVDRVKTVELPENHFVSKFSVADLEEANLRQQLGRCYAPRCRPDGDGFPRDCVSRRRSSARAALYSSTARGDGCRRHRFTSGATGYRAAARMRR